MKQTTILLLLPVIILLSQVSIAQESVEKREAPMMIPFSALKWSEHTEIKGMQYATIRGDPKKGAYAEMRRIQGGTQTQLHSHSSEVTNIVISGTFFTGPDPETAQDFGPGSVIIVPAGWVHLGGCREGEDCIIYQEGKDKFEVIPASDKDK
jgi:quercetin dioxygenase-like cupin family protein